VSALTRATLDRICGEPVTRSLATAMMREAQAVAGKLGIASRAARAAHRGRGARRRAQDFMLQDIEAGRATELEALVGSVLELARLTEHAGAVHRGGVRLHAPPPGQRLRRACCRESGLA